MPTTVEVDVHDVLEHQVAARDSAARWKVLNCGRRWGKDRLALHAALVGHGPVKSDGRPTFEAIAQGWDVLWLARDYPQAKSIWTEEIRPRFASKPLIRLTEKPFYAVSFGDMGTLHIRSAENIDSIRGIGKRLKGVIKNEAAFIDLRLAWLSVVRPMLMDNEGWAIIMSTPNAGLDGNAEKVTPSFFNRICEDIKAGRRKSPTWELFEGNAYDNPEISDSEVDELVGEYQAGSLELQQEVFAKLLEGRHGTAFPMWRDELHIVDRFRVPPYWRWAGGLDWGYRAPGCFTLFACGPEGDVVCVDEMYFNDQATDKMHAYEAGHAVGMLCRRYPMAEYVAADEQMWYETGVSGKTLAMEFLDGLQAAYGMGPCPVLVEAMHGRGSRAVKMQVMQRMLGWRAIKKGEKGFTELKDKRGVLRFEGGLVPPWHRPKLRFTDLCKASIRTIPKLVYDPKAKREDVDTTQEDHAYDSVCCFLMSGVPQAELPPTVRDEDRHPGFSKGGRKKQQQEPLGGANEKPWAFGRQAPMIAVSAKAYEAVE